MQHCLVGSSVAHYGAAELRKVQRSSVRSYVAQ
jgi:hypothetical protein